MKKIYKILLIVVAVVVVLVAAVALLVSPLTKRYIEKNSPELIGRQVTMDKLRINIFTGRLQVENLRIAGAEDSTTFFSLGALDVKMRLLPLVRERVIVDRIAFTQPDLKIYQRGSEFNFDGILAKFPADTTQVEAAPSEWEIGLYDISIARGHIFYKDLLLDAAWGLNDLDIRIPGVYFSGEKTDVGVLLNFAEGGSLETSIAYNVETSDYDLGIKLKEFALDGTLPYLRQSLQVSDVDGRLGADLHIRGNSNHLLSARVSGTASLTGFALRDNGGAAVVTADTLAADLAEGGVEPMRFRFNRIYASGVTSLVELRADGTNNLTALLKPAEQAPVAATAAAESSAPVELYVADLDIRRTGVTLRDQTLHRPFEYRITDIRMRSRDFNPAARNKLTIDARMQKTGSAKLIWDGSLDDINNQNITFVLNNVNLSDFGPYCEHYTAYPVTGGNLSFRSQNVIRSRNLDGTNHLDMFEPKADKKRKDLDPEFKIPLKLGLYVLKDKKGHVKMDLPVKGNLDSPEFSYRKIVLKTIGNVLLKVVTAPFSFLGGHSDHIEYVGIEALQTAFSSEQYAAFDKLALILQDKPEMKFTLTQRVNLGKALQAQARTNLLMNYYNRRQAADSAAQRPQLTLLDYDKILALNVKADSIALFADSLLRMRGTEPAGMSPAQKAMALYEAPARAQLARMLHRRDSALLGYMNATHALPPERLHVQTADSTALQGYAGRDRYTIAIEVDGESVEVQPEGETAAAESAGASATTGDPASAAAAAGSLPAGPAAAPEAPAAAQPATNS